MYALQVTIRILMIGLINTLVKLNEYKYHRMVRGEVNIAPNVIKSMSINKEYKRRGQD